MIVRILDIDGINMAAKVSSGESSGALRRGLKIVGLLYQRYPESLSIREISQETGLPRPTVYRLLETLTHEGYASSNPQTKTFYFDGFKPRTPSKSALYKNLEIVISRMKEIAQLTDDAVYLVVRQANNSLCVHREFGNYPIQVNSLAIGQSQPLGIGSGGLAILAASNDEEVEATLTNNASRFMEYNGISVPIIRQLIRNTRARGYALVGNYAISGVTGVGMAVYEKGVPIAGLCVSSVTERMSLSHQRLIAKCLREALRNLK